MAYDVRMRQNYQLLNGSDTRTCGHDHHQKMLLINHIINANKK